MATFCGNCGTSNDSGAFCFNCGQSLAAPASAPAPAYPSVPTPPAYQSVPTPPSATPVTHLPPPAGYPMARPPAPRVNPFVGWPVSDYLRDAGATFCLFACLGMWWEISIDPAGGERWWVVIAVLLSVASLATPYLAKAAVVPGWTPLHWRLVKAASIVPFLASALAAVINELVHVGDDFEGGIGAGVGMGLCGAMLALQPREADDPMRREDRYWNVAGIASALGAAGLALLMFAGFAIDTDDLFDEPLAFFAIAVVAVGMLLVVMGWPMLNYLTGSASGRRVFGTAAFTLMGVALFAHADDGSALFYWPQVEKWYGGVMGFGGIGIGGTLLIGAAAGLSVAHSLGRRPTEQTEPAAEWIRTASTALMVSFVGTSVALLAVVLGIAKDSDELASAIVVAVLMMAIAADAGLAYVLLADPRKNRPLILGMIAVCVVLGFVVMGVVNGNDMNIEALGSGPSVPLTGWVVAVWLTLPLLAGCSLTVPKAVRDALGPLVPQQSGYYPQAYPTAGPPHSYPPQQPPYPPQG